MFLSGFSYRFLLATTTPARENDVAASSLAGNDHWKCGKQYNTGQEKSHVFGQIFSNVFTMLVLYIVVLRPVCNIQVTYKIMRKQPAQMGGVSLPDFLTQLRAYSDCCW
jgi:hypothetical protein